MSRHINSIKITPHEFQLIMDALHASIGDEQQTIHRDDRKRLRTQLANLYDYRNYQIMAWMEDDRPF